MGWGWLFFGYFLEYILGLNALFAPFVHVVAWAMMYAGLSGLQRYCHSFRYAKWCTIAAAVLSVWCTLADLETAFSLSLGFVADGVTQVVTWGMLAVSLAFHTLLTMAVEEMSKRVSLQKNVMRARRNLTVVYLYAAFYIAQRIIGALGLAPAVILGRLLFAICNCVLLYSCYMHIAPANQSEASAPAPSRFAFVNRWRRAFDEKEQKAIEADRRYHAENARRRYEKQTERMSQKQRAKEDLRNKRRGD